MSARRKSRSKKKARVTLWARAWTRLGSVTTVLLVVGLLTLVGSSLQTQRLIGLRQKAAALEVELAEARARRNAVHTQLTEARRYERIADRARLELGMVDSDATLRTFVSLPAAPSPREPGLVARLADRLDRFSRVRASFAAENEK